MKETESEEQVFEQLANIPAEPPLKRQLCVNCR